MKHVQGVPDLNNEVRESVAFPSAGSAYVRRQIGVRPAHGSSSVEEFCSNRATLWWRSSSTAFQLCQPVSLHGVCTTDVPGKLARHRSLSAGSAFEALSPEHPWQRVA